MKSISEYLVHEKQPIIEAIKVIQGNLSRCAVVVNDGNKVVGVFSEGDVLRAILNEVDLYVPVRKVLKPSFLSLESRDLKKALALVKKHGISLVPIINESYELTGVITLLELLEKLDFVPGVTA